MITIAGKYPINDPELLIRDYCRVEVYHGYDDSHSINNVVSDEDIRSANSMYARIGLNAAQRLKGSKELPEALAGIPNSTLGELTPSDWNAISPKLSLLFQESCSIAGVGLAIATKILHLKRPALIPILDANTIKILLNRELKKAHKQDLPALGMQAVEIIKTDLEQHKELFCLLQQRLQDLPIPLGPLRIYDILAWSIKGRFIRGAKTTT